MPRLTTLKAAFAYFGTVAKNPVWAWSAVSPDGGVVAITVWDDEVRPDGSLDYFNAESLHLWVHRNGNRDRIKNLQHALDHCDGLVRVVRVTAKDPAAETREIIRRFADPEKALKITELNCETGEFRAIPVSLANKE